MRTPVLLAIALIFVASSVLADEIVIDRSSKTAGDFFCSPLTNRACPQFDLNSGVVSAGELWTFFDANGAKSIHQLSLCLDLDSMEDEASFGLEAIELKIEDPELQGALLTSVSLGNDWITVPGYETSAFAPEAKLALELNYDFMKRFSADSKEKIFVTFQSKDEAIVPKFTVQSESAGFFSGFKNSTMLISFTVFWLVFFYLLARLTKPSPEIVEPAPSPRGDQLAI